jgi:hypothetical protein
MISNPFWRASHQRWKRRAAQHRVLRSDRDASFAWGFAPGAIETAGRAQGVDDLVVLSKTSAERSIQDVWMSALAIWRDCAARARGRVWGCRRRTKASARRRR